MTAVLPTPRDADPAGLRRHEPQRARCGRSRAVAPPSRRTARSRPYPHRFSRPARQDGQASIPPARSADAAAASAHSSTEGLPGHDGHDAPAGPHARQGQLVLQPARSGRGPQPRTPHPPGNDIMTTIRPRPWSRDRHRAAPCSQCRRARKRTPAASPGPACSCRTTPILLQALRKNGAEHSSIHAGVASGSAPGLAAARSPSRSPRFSSRSASRA